jgi:1-deoxy-D-xylulose-5-phosphate reductoisomerase
MKKRKNIAILGSTGSIGTQALQVVDEHPDLFQVEVLTANNNIDLLIQQAKKYKPNIIVIANEDKYNQLQSEFENSDIKVYAGEEAISQVVENENIDIVLTALVGFSGLKSTLKAIDAGKDIALANKETLVVAGEIIMKRAVAKNINIIPVDSEHSAIFQCLVGEAFNPIEKIILTASGGPFRGFSTNQLKNVSSKDALKHPNWDMGNKISIDSATMMNKGLEVIEAKWLFNLKPSQIDVIVHKQSIIHSLVQFEDGSIKAQMGLPDMKLPIQYALGFPRRIKNSFKRFDFADFSELNFEKPDLETFKTLKLAYQALEKAGNMPCILNAANEIAVELFLANKIGFLQIAEYIQDCMNNIDFIKTPSIEDLIDTDRITREYLINKINLK